MKIRKLIIFILAALLATAALCACGGDETEGGSSDSGSVSGSYASSADETQGSAEDGGESSGSSLNENYFQSSVML